MTTKRTVRRGVQTREKKKPMSSDVTIRTVHLMIDHMAESQIFSINIPDDSHVFEARFLSARLAFTENEHVFIDIDFMASLRASTCVRKFEILICLAHVDISEATNAPLDTLTYLGRAGNRFVFVDESRKTGDDE